VPFFHHYGCKENPFLECPQLESLDIQTDELSVLTDESFSPLKNLKRFSIHHNERISPRAMDHLSSLTSLMPMDIRKGAVQCVDDTALSHLQNLRELCVGTSSLNIISDRGLRQMSYLTFLDICDCGCRGGITDHAFQHMKHLKELNMCDCKQTGLSNHMFSHLSNLSKLKMDGCTQSTITDHAFAHLSNLKRLSLVQCTQITSDALRHVPHLEVLACEIGEDTKAWNTPKLQLTTDEICCREEDDEEVKNCLPNNFLE
jgi:Leucine-rich repeat (LRR) protein